jgi:hypothetical protein
VRRDGGASRVGPHGLTRRGNDRYGEPPPARDFEGLDAKVAGPLADLDVDVGDDELQRRLDQGLHNLAVLVGLAGRTSRDRLWDLVVSEVEPATARAVAFTAAVLAAGQTPRVT